MVYYILKAMATTLAFPVALVVLYVRYHTMRYRFDEQGIRVSWGILFRREIMLNYSRIQDINVHSSFVERYLGLARIEIQTAASSSQSEMTLEGIENPAAMRDFLYSRMRGSSAQAHDPQPHGGLAEVLQEVTQELRAIRLLLEERRRA